ncbi:MAG: DUF1501 domain-containing protein [Planctomycetota bacterium]|nr:DUF1501 domain-containing protein [Planctomycetota bacterium]MDA1213785.1 DUF1501 domain-containing protein [Planctomycetota bacterium]
MIPSNSPFCRGPVSRREFLQVGTLALGGICLADVLAARAAQGENNRDTSVIMLYTHGGASQLETYDLKPQAPVEYRSIYKPIATNVPGMEICEKFPLQAKLADKFSLIRSLHHDVGIHSDGGIVVLTGKRPTVLDPTSQSKSEHPDFGMIAGSLRGLGDGGLPNYIGVPSMPYMTRPNYIGVEFAGYQVNDPGNEDYAPPSLKISADRNPEQMIDRRKLLAQFDRFQREIDNRQNMERVDKFRDIAFEMMTNPATREAFDINQEPAELRDKYGRNTWGQSCLMARRLAEAGTAVVNIYFNTPKTGDEFTNWDDHIMNAGRPGHFGKFMDIRLPYMDQALSTLIEDIHERSLDKKILVVVVGEFGRTPRLSKNANGVGRDHWPQAYTALVSGGNFKMGQVIGATNSKAEFPAHRPYTPQDFLATIYRHLGIDSYQAFNDYSGRPIPILPFGEPIAELI